MATTGGSNPMARFSTGSRRCPICGKPAAARHQPFCSARCANIDLSRWLKGNYAVETEETPEDAAERDAD
jgi:hypothetical protein